MGLGEGNGIDADVKRLILESIESVEHVEILLLLRANADRGWSAKDVTQKLRNSEESAQRRLADLASKGALVQVPGTDPTAYQYSPANEAQGRILDKLAKTYAERRVSVIELIFSKPRERIQVFADAFRLRKDKDDG